MTSSSFSAKWARRRRLMCNITAQIANDDDHRTGGHQQAHGDEHDESPQDRDNETGPVLHRPGLLADRSMVRSRS
ncbi:hypothetical protein U9M48_005591 [Paspalum notatum var. saurae]|uniref:Uncharacterized protein n=1 Tax=Paspalum notatum var. saurae TaxID=547442 RepID=A0AAQ3PXW6_PASNO